MTLEIGVSVFVAVVFLVVMAATWIGRAKREPFVRELEMHYESLGGTKRPHLRVVPREKYPTPKATQKAQRRR